MFEAMDKNKAEEKVVKMLTRGSRSSSDGEGCSEWWVFPIGTSREAILQYLEERLGVEVKGYGTGVDYSPSGRWFARSVIVYDKKKSTVAYQSFGLDL